MILRDVIYADKPRALQNAGLVVPVAKSVIPVSIVNALNIVASASPPPSPPVEKLSIERVMEWLDSQDDAVRLMIAQNLVEEIEQVRAEAIMEGRAVGVSAAKSEFSAQCATALEALHAVTSKCEVLFVQQRDDLVKQCVHIVGTALTRLVGEAIVHPDASVAAVKQAVQKVCGARDVIIRVNKKDVEIIAAHKSALAEILGGNELSIVADQRVPSGGCLLESSFGEIDARWETQLLALLNALRNDRDTEESQ
jgi:flagellar assembly protein FliH